MFLIYKISSHELFNIKREATLLTPHDNLKTVVSGIREQ